MEHWIFISNPKRFRMKDWLAENEYVEFSQRNKVCVNDIIYLYSTAPICRIEYKMIVDKVNVPHEELIDDSAYSLRPNPEEIKPWEKIVRLKLIERVESPQLHLSILRNYGLKSSMQGNLKVKGALLDYIESFF